MSAGFTLCQGCNVRLSVRAEPGMRFKCPRCGTPIEIAAEPSRPAVPPKANSGGAATKDKWYEDQAAARLTAAPPKPTPVAPRATAPAQAAPPPRVTAVPPKPKAVVVKDEDDRPRAGKKKAEASGLPIGLLLGLVGGGVFFLLLVGGALAFVLLRGGKGSTSEDRKDEPQRSVSSDDKKDPPRNGANPNRRDEPPPEQKPPVQQPAPSGDGSLPADVLRKIKEATVYIRVEGADGKASGSGFYEESTGKIFTNAHVLGMKSFDAPRPTKIEVLFHSGTPSEVVIPAGIVAVDRLSDLAVLDAPFPPGQANIPPPLTVNAAKDLTETQRVYVVDFPFGERVNRNVTIAPSNVSSLQLDQDGILKQVQVNGGMHPGNSGGPVVDTRGNVVGVAVAGIPGTQINFAIPGESVLALLRGRLSGISINTEAVPQGGKFVVRVRFETLDPSQRIKGIAVDYWVGPAQPKGLPPTPTRPNLAPGLVRQTIQTTYTARNQQATGELVLDALPGVGQMLWVQPVVTAGDNVPTWAAGSQYAIQPPVDPQPATLTFQPRVGQGPVNLKSTARFKVEGAGEKHTLLQSINTQLNENTLAVDASGTRVALTVQKFEVGVSEDGEAPETSKRWQEAIKRDVGQLRVDLRLDPKGNVAAKKNDFGKSLPQSRDILDTFGTQIATSFETAAIPLPGGVVQPGQTWQAQRRVLLFDVAGGSQPAASNVTYTYRGLRPYNGKMAAVVELRGVLSSGDRASNLTGKATGSAVIDPDTGLILHAHTVYEATLTIRYRGDNFRATGTLEATLDRNAAAR